MISKDEFLKWEQSSRDTIDIKKIYIDITSDLVSGVLLSQIIYWNLPSKKSDTKLRVEKEGELWLAKGRESWWDEIRLTAKQVDRALGILKENKIIETKIFKFDGNPTLHIKIIWDELLPKISILANANDQEEQRGKTKFTKGKKRNSPLVNNDIDERGISITETTTEITTETTKTEQVVEIEKLIKETQFSSIPPHAIINLSKKYSVEKIYTMLEILIYQYANKPVNNPTGLLITSLKNGLEPPPGYVSREERERQNKIKLEKEKKESEERKAIEAMSENEKSDIRKLINITKEKLALSS